VPYIVRRCSCCGGRSLGHRDAALLVRGGRDAALLVRGGGQALVYKFCYEVMSGQPTIGAKGRYRYGTGRKKRRDLGLYDLETHKEQAARFPKLWAKVAKVLRRCGLELEEPRVCVRC
jgi:hypothetical protein